MKIGTGAKKVVRSNGETTAASIKGQAITGFI
jgi:hypothetical protein